MSRKEVLRPGLLRAALAGQIGNAQGAAALHLTVRQFQRLKARYRLEGARGVPHRSRGRASPRRMAAATRTAATALLQGPYAAFNDTHAWEHLGQHGLGLSRESVRRLRRALGQPAVRRRRAPRHRSRRPREAAMGSLVQLDASPYAWLEDRGPELSLHGAIDDATGEVLALHFRPTEDLHGYATVLHAVFTTYGLPVSVYGDGTTILVRSDAHWSLDEQLAGAQAPTHLGRVLQELGIGYIRARSPQGKGRVERLWGTLQDRLTSELRLHGLRTLAAANAFLPVFRTAFNRRFARPAAAAPVWRRPPADLARRVGCTYDRVVGRDHTLRLGPRLIAIPRGRGGRVYAGRRVQVRELLSGGVVVRCDGQVIATAPAPGPDFVLVPRRAPSGDRPRRPRSRRPLQAALAQLTAALTPAPPPRPHPWRRGFSPKALSITAPRG